MYQSVIMLFLLAYPLVLVYAAALAFVPVNLTPTWIGVSWTDLFAAITTLVINAAHSMIKSVIIGQTEASRVNSPEILALKTTLLMFGLIYSFFQNP